MVREIRIGGGGGVREKGKRRGEGKEGGRKGKEMR